VQKGKNAGKKGVWKSSFGVGILRTWSDHTDNIIRNGTGGRGGPSKGRKAECPKVRSIGGTWEKTRCEGHLGGNECRPFPARREAHLPSSPCFTQRKKKIVLEQKGGEQQ